MAERIIIIGASGSGKTTLARAAARRIGCRHQEIDALFWEPGWTRAPAEVFSARVGAVIAGESWVIDGNFSSVRAQTWARATTIVWLNYPRALVMRRLIWRTLRRALTGEVLWSHNRESLARALRLWDDTSILRWSWTSWAHHQRLYPELFAAPEHAHLRVHTFTSPAQARAWLDALC